MPKKYQEIYNKLRSDIQSHVFQNGEKLPSETQMMESYNVSRQTVRRVLSLLEEEGLIRKSRGSGSFVQFAEATLNTKKIAVLFYDLDISTFPAVMRRIDEILYQQGYTTAFYSTAGSDIKERTVLQQLVDSPVDGIIMHAGSTSLTCSNMDLILELKNRGTKLLFFESWYGNFEFLNDPIISIENYAGPYRATEYLIQHGYKHIGGFFCLSSLSYASRFSGICNAFLSHGIKLDRKKFFEISVVEDLEKIMMPEAVEIFQTLDAFICPGGILLDPLVKALQQYGAGNLRTVIVFDETPIPQIDGVEFVVFQYAVNEIAELCAQKILELINGLMVESIQVPWHVSELTTVKDIPVDFFK